MKFKNERSLERSLVRDFPGAKNVLDALQKVKTQRLNDSALQTTLELPINEYETMRDAIKDIENASKGFDFSKVDKETNASLSKMPITTTEEVGAWVAAWLKILNLSQSSKS